MKQVEISKELDDVLALIENLVIAIKAKKSITEIAAGELSDLVNAVAGIDQVPGEISDSRHAALQTIGLRLGSISDALLGVPAPAAV